MIEDGAIAAKDGLIAWLGHGADLPGPAMQTADCHGAWILPGLIGRHTHLVLGGDRAAESELLLKGVSYEEITRADGGILSTVEPTRETDEDSLLRAAGLRWRSQPT